MTLCRATDKWAFVWQVQKTRASGPEHCMENSHRSKFCAFIQCNHLKHNCVNVIGFFSWGVPLSVLESPVEQSIVLVISPPFPLPETSVVLSLSYCRTSTEWWKDLWVKSQDRKRREGAGDNLLGTCFCHFLAVSTWVSHLTFLNLCFSSL